MTAGPSPVLARLPREHGLEGPVRPERGSARTDGRTPTLPAGEHPHSNSNLHRISAPMFPNDELEMSLTLS